MILYLLLSLLLLAVFELSRIRLAGFVLMAVCSLVFLFIRKVLVPGRPFVFRLGVFASFLLVAFLLFSFFQPEYEIRRILEEYDYSDNVYEVTGGKVRGVLTTDHAVEAFAGIPYANNCSYERRWTEPKDPFPWDYERYCSFYEPMSMQPENPMIVQTLTQIIGYHDYTFSLKDNFRDYSSEDSLYLNLWRPNTDQTKLPVLVFIHGGSLETGQTWWGDYNGENLARKGVIVVNMAYRLGAYGFYGNSLLAEESENHTTGNYGLLDQIKALQWVQDNIAAFGGDPENVTLAGESAGSACVSALLTSPLAKGLFQKAILESSTVTAPYPAHSFRSYEAMLEAGDQLMKETQSRDLEDLRWLSTKELNGYTAVNHHITVDGYVLEKTPYESLAEGVCNAQAILHGFNKSEGSLFILFNNAKLKDYEEKVRALFKDQADEILKIYTAADEKEAKENWIFLYSVYFFNYGHYHLSRQCLANQIPCYEYTFTKNNGRLGYQHGGEMNYFYHTIPSVSRLFDESDYELEEKMSDYFVNFIRNGDPNGSNLPHWPQIQDEMHVFELGDKIGEIYDISHPVNRILDALYGVNE